MKVSWSVHDEADPYAVARQVRTAGDYRYWRALEPVEEILETLDWTTHVTGLTRSTGMSKAFITRNLDALYTLDQLPRLRELVESTWVLDMHYLTIIDAAVSRAPQGLKEDPFFWHTLDQDLVARMTPTRAHQLLPSTRAVRDVIQTAIRTLQVPADTGPSPWGPAPEPPEDREQRDEEDGTPAGPLPCDDVASLMRSLPPADDTPSSTLWIDTLDDGHMRFELIVDQSTGVLLQDGIWKTAKDLGISQARAMTALILAQVTTTVTTHLYTAGDVPNAPVFHPLAGALTEQAAERLLAMSTTKTDMDGASGAATDSYTPTAEIRAYLVGRDWTCRWPGCTTPAIRGDCDHRINHDEGGPTTAANMVMLCRHHHNRKTDVQAAYLLDPVTGDVFWMFADGTWAVDRAEGPLAPAEKHWVQTYAQRRTRRDEAAASRAAGEEFETYQARTVEQAELKCPIKDNGPDPPPR